MSTSTATNVGRITQVIGSTFDAEFPDGHLPPIYNAVANRLSTEKGVNIDLTGEIQQHSAETAFAAWLLVAPTVCVADLSVLDTGKPVSVPVGQEHSRSRVQRARQASR